MNIFASGPKSHYYGKSDVVVYRLGRNDSSEQGPVPVFGATVQLLVYGDAFWPTYATGDNTGLVATDSMKNFIQRQALQFPGHDLDAFVRFIAERFCQTYPQVEGAQMSARQIPYTPLDATVGFVPSGPEYATARIELGRSGVVEAVSGIRGFKLLRMGGSAFTGFVRDEYTTLPETTNRPLHMWLDLEWQYADPAQACSDGRIVGHVGAVVRDVFERFESGSIQQVIYQMGTRLLAEVPEMREVHLEAGNHTWDLAADGGPSLAVFTEPRPSFGCLGLRLTR